MLCRRMRLTERHVQPPREPIEGPILRPCTSRNIEGKNKEGDIAVISVTHNLHHGR